MYFINRSIVRIICQLCLLWLSIGIISAIAGSVSYAQTASDQAPETETTAFSPEQIQQILQEADTYFQQQEFTASYDLYLRVLGVEPTNSQARTRIFQIIQTYKTRVETAQQQQDSAQMQQQYQQYREMVRGFLQVLTTQLKREIQYYGELVVAAKSGKVVKTEIVAALTTMIQVLEDLKTMYADFPQGEQDAAGTKKVIDRLDETIKKYKQELLSYQ